jgi:hypothetical protein
VEEELKLKQKEKKDDEREEWLEIATLNVRGIRDERRWLDLENVIYWQKTAITVLTETSRSQALTTTPKSILTFEEQGAELIRINESPYPNEQGLAKKRLMKKMPMSICQTKPTEVRGTGVAIVSDFRWKLAPLLAELWTNCTCACMASKKDKDGMSRMIVIGHYSKHG